MTNRQMYSGPMYKMAMSAKSMTKLQKTLVSTFCSWLSSCCLATVGDSSMGSSSRSEAESMAVSATTGFVFLFLIVLYDM